ncbi:DUF2490 domain-containing protein [Rasiella sp. SM2506]|uniref:DUF2490 domain-containing protein n=1 Tax=Rasiella sp. SM2506 TaxID=3423914 RepID=UPI003D7984B5
MRIATLFFLLMVSNTESIAQGNFTSFFEPEIELKYAVTERYTQSFGIENRNFIYRNTNTTYTVKQIDISHFSEFAIKENQSVAIGIQYRFEETFNKTEENELRFMQQWEWENRYSNFIVKNRVRNEQRVYASTTKYRIRYELGFKFPLQADQKTYFKTETEALFELAKTQKPEFEQRATAVYGFIVLPKTNLEVGLQYRLAEYTQTIGHEVFAILGVEISL